VKVRDCELGNGHYWATFRTWLATVRRKLMATLYSTAALKVVLSTWSVIRRDVPVSRVFGVYITEVQRRQRRLRGLTNQVAGVMFNSGQLLHDRMRFMLR